MLHFINFISFEKKYKIEYEVNKNDQLFDLGYKLRTKMLMLHY